MMRHREARKRAIQVLDLVGVDGVPIDVEAVASYLGFDVIQFDFPDDVSGVTFISGDLKSIGVNKNHAKTRQRFSIAHELGHYLLGHESYDEEMVHVDRGQWSATSHNQQEQEANEFAAELLMPENLLACENISKDVNALDLSRKYQVSEQAFWIQLFDHRFLTEKKVK